MIRFRQFLMPWVAGFTAAGAIFTAMSLEHTSQMMFVFSAAVWNACAIALAVKGRRRFADSPRNQNLTSQA